MIDDRFLKLMQCPITGAALHVADSTLVSRLNERVADGSLANRDGETIKDKFESGLVDANNQWFYPSWNGIPSLLAEDAIALDGTPTT